MHSTKGYTVFPSGDVSGVWLYAVDRDCGFKMYDEVINNFLGQTLGGYCNGDKDPSLAFHCSRTSGIGDGHSPQRPIAREY